MWNQDVSGWLGLYHDHWFPGSLHHQVMKLTRGIIFVLKIKKIKDYLQFAPIFDTFKECHL